jgi:hypothetical protein
MKRINELIQELEKKRDAVQREYDQSRENSNYGEYTKDEIYWDGVLEGFSMTIEAIKETNDIINKDIKKLLDE